MEDEVTLEAFRLRFRVSILERLVLSTYFAAPVLSRRLSAQESHHVLKQILQQGAASALDVYGKHFGDPALTALYADEAKSITDRMEGMVDELYKLWQEQPF